MLAIRMQRTGRKGYPTYRVIVQEAHRQPTSGRVVASIGSYNPHTKESTLDKEKAEYYLKNGAQPSDRVVKLLQAEKVALPAWVSAADTTKQKSIKNAEKLRKNRPAEEAAPEEPVAEEAPAAEVDAAPAEEAAAEPAVEVEAPAEEATESTEQIAAAEVADGQETVEDETAEPAEAADEEKTEE